MYKYSYILLNTAAPIDTSMNIEIVANKKTLTTVRNKKKELKDLDNHAWQSDSESSSNVLDALENVDELETTPDKSKESMYKLSYVVRVTASSLNELKKHCNEVKDFYDNLSIKLVRPFGDMPHGEFLFASKRYMNEFIQYVTSDFLAGLGFGATQELGDGNQFYVEIVSQYLAVESFDNETVQIIMNEALKYEGWKYVYGGANPNMSFDCSGLVQWCYAKAGISLPRTAQAQYDATQHIPMAEARPGDLVFSTVRIMQEIMLPM